MNNIDGIIKANTKSESLLLPEGFEEQNDTLITKPANHSKTSKKLFMNPLYHKLSAVALLIVLVLAQPAAAAYSPSGEEFSKRFYIDKATNNVVKNHSHMNTEQFDNMASSTAGTVVDTDNITIDVMGATISGNTAEIMLKVTAKQLDTVLYYTGIGPLNNYRFNDDLGGSLSENNETTSIRYYYSDKDKSLAPNQFKICYKLIAKDNFKKDQYSMKLSNFGYFTHGDGIYTDFKSIYDDSWQFKVAFDSKSDSSKNININKQITVGRYSFILNKINITPLACTISFKCNQTKKFINKNLNKIYSDFINGIKDCSLTLKDGTKLSSEIFTMIPSGGEEGFTLVLDFNVPVTVDDISSISILGIEIPIK